jgi:hypothetical protein
VPAKVEHTFRESLVLPSESNPIERLSRWSVWSADCGTVYIDLCAFPSGISYDVLELYNPGIPSPSLQTLLYPDGPTWMLRRLSSTLCENRTLTIEHRLMITSTNQMPDKTPVGLTSLPLVGFLLTVL